MNDDNFYPIGFNQDVVIKINPYMRKNKDCKRCVNNGECCMYCFGGDMFNDKKSDL